MSKNEYYNINDIFNILGITREFESKCPVFPFNYGTNKVEFGWGDILIPRKGIRETILNKLKDESTYLKEINMIYCIPFIVSDYGHKKGELKAGCLYKNIGITFDYGHQFLSYYVINNQYGIGALRVGSAPMFSISLPDKNANVKTDTKEESKESSNTETSESNSLFETCLQSFNTINRNNRLYLDEEEIDN